ncbi:hypothetical protein FQN52_009204 [Onygenales sp. PD_12]|nr:hypothetical protein FQN52_009204 [Onygenales sp. PD_12]
MSRNASGDIPQPPQSSPDRLPRLNQRRHANLYDAVAGRVSSDGFRGQSIPNRTPAPSTSVPVAPEEVLFRRVNAPIRYAENDFYFADERLLPERSLPESDTLKAIHTYASDFYTSTTLDQGQTDWQSMDETALIALGILLEEAANESLGETGDMVFVEGEEVSEEGLSSHMPSKLRGRKRVTVGSSSAISGEEVARPRQSRKKRRRRDDTEHPMEPES